MQVVAEEVGGARQSATAKVEIFLLYLFVIFCGAVMKEVTTEVVMAL